MSLLEIELIDKPELKNVQLDNSSKLGIDSQAFFSSSGLNVILQTIKKHLKNDIDLAFFEYSSIVSALERNTNLASLCCWSEKRNNEFFAKNIQKYFLKIINHLIDQNSTIYYHPEFLFESTKGYAYVTCGNDMELTTSLKNDELINSLYENILNHIESNLSNSDFHFDKISKINEDIYVKNANIPINYNDIITKVKEFEYKEKSPLYFNLILHLLYRKFFIPNNSKSAFISIPVLGAPRKENISVFTGQTAFYAFITFKDEIPTEKLAALVKDIENNLKTFTINYLYDIGFRLLKRSLYNANKSAKSAIMSRNMSHNLGSHVMVYLKAKLKDVGTLVKDGVLEELISSKQCQLDPTKCSGLNLGDKLELPFLIGLGHFINYLQERQDYIATISTDYIPFFNTTNFKDSVFDCLNVDYRFKRHKSRRSGYMPDNILLDNIARSEKLSRDNISVQFATNVDGKERSIFDGINDYERDANGEKLHKRNSKGEYVFKKDIDGKSVAVLDDKGKPKIENGKTVYEKEPIKGEGFIALAELRNFEIDLPGGITGRQAIFSIFENIIRNAAKHNSDNTDLTLTFALTDIINDGLTYEYYQYKENKLDVNNDVIDNDFSDNIRNSYYQLSITDNKKSADESVLTTLRKAIIEDYVDERGKMNDTYKGIKEMRISAAWLRHEKDEQAVSKAVIEKMNLPIIQVKADEAKNLQYVFYLRKPKTLALIIEDDSSYTKLIDRFNKKYNQKNAWYFYTDSNFLQDIDVDFDLIVTLSDKSSIDNNEKEKNKESLKDRISRLTNSYIVEIKKLFDDGIKITENSNLLSFHNKYKFESELYKIIANELFCDKLPKIIIIDPIATSYQSNYIENGNKICKHIDIQTTPKDNDYAGNVVFKNHYGSKEEVLAFEKYLLKGNQPLTVESITGHNSTDRIIRNQLLDDIWYYKQIIAANTKVAIFDERLFENCYDIKTRELQPDYSYVKKLSKKDILGCIELSETDKNTLQFNILNAILNNADIKSEFKQKYEEIKKASKQNKTKKQQIQLALNGLFANGMNCTESAYAIIVNKDLKPNNKDLAKKLNDVIPTSKQIASHKTSIFQRKNILLFNIDWDNNKKQFTIFGKDEKNKNVIEIGTITVNIKAEKIVQIGFYSYANKFDYFLIHQGLLDKLYDKAACKSGSEEDSETKIKITNTFCNNILKDKLLETDGDTHKGFIIHSGRSKPALYDMPQKQPFIQYAALENAVLDCKYTLVELLNSARYAKPEN